MSSSEDEWEEPGAGGGSKKRGLSASQGASSGGSKAPRGGKGKAKATEAHSFTDEEVMAAVTSLKKTMQRPGGGASSSSTAVSLGYTDALEVREVRNPQDPPHRRETSFKKTTSVTADGHI